jgi:hypothetical protein
LARKRESTVSNTWIRRSLGLGLFMAVPAVEAAGAYTPGAMPALTNEGSITAMAAGDLDGDGRSDLYLVYGNRGGGVGGTETALADVLLRGVPGGYEPAAAGFDAAAPVAGTGVVLADFDRDGDRDVLVAGGGTYDGATTTTVPAPTQLFRNLGGGQFAVPTPIGPVQRSTGIAAGDIDGDGDLDVALARSNGRVDVYRNDSAVGGGIVFALQQQLVAASGPAPELGALAFGDISGDGRADLLVLRVLDSGSAANPEPRGVVSFIGNAANGYGPATVVPMPEGVPTGLAVADFDLDGRADVAVSATIGSIFLGPVTAASRVLRGTPGGLVVSPVRFPAHAHTAVAAGDLDADGRPDLVFGRRRCTPTVLGCLDQALSSLVFYFGTPGGFEAGPQCLGRHADAATRVLVAELDADALADVAFAGQRPVQGDGDGLGWLRNGATGTGNACCMAELGGDLADGALARGAPAGPGAADIGALARVRDVLMPDSSAGPRLLARYQTFNPEVIALMRGDPTLWRDAATVLARWARPVRDLVDGRGAQRVVDQDMVDAVDGFLQRLSTTGSPALAAAIADERARLPPFGDLVGLSMDEFRAIALPADLILRDGFEAP